MPRTGLIASLGPPEPMACQLPWRTFGISVIRLFNQYVSPRALVLLPVEGVVILLSLLCSVKLALWNDPAFAEQPLGPQLLLIRAFGFLILVQVSFYFNNLYDLGGGLSFQGV